MGMYNDHIRIVGAPTKNSFKLSNQYQPAYIPPSPLKRFGCDRCPAPIPRLPCTPSPFPGAEPRACWDGGRRPCRHAHPGA
jgi:hypothetical protein